MDRRARILRVWLDRNPVPDPRVVNTSHRAVSRPAGDRGQHLADRTIRPGHAINVLVFDDHTRRGQALFREWHEPIGENLVPAIGDEQVNGRPVTSIAGGCTQFRPLRRLFVAPRPAFTR